MSAAPPKVYPILATPFGEVPLPEVGARNAALVALLSAHAAASPGRGADRLCYESTDELFEWQVPDVQAALHDMVRGLLTVISTVSDVSAAQLASFELQARAWFVIVQPDGAMSARIARLASWCAAYCVAAPAAASARRDSGTLRLYESRFGTMFADATNATLRQPFTPGHSAWLPEPGKLAVFPASVMHEVALVKATSPLVLLMLKARFVAPGQEGWAGW